MCAGVGGVTAHFKSHLQRPTQPFTAFESFGTHVPAGIKIDSHVTCAGRQADDPGDAVLGGRVAARVGLRARVPAGRAAAGARDGAPAARPARRARAARPYTSAHFAFTALAVTQGKVHHLVRSPQEGNGGIILTEAVF